MGAGVPGAGAGEGEGDVGAVGPELLPPQATRQMLDAAMNATQPTLYLWNVTSFNRPISGSTVVLAHSSVSLNIPGGP